MNYKAKRPSKNYNKLCMDSKMLWLFIGVGIFAFTAFVLPTPESLKNRYGISNSLAKTTKCHLD